jgi:hypothetical protein
MDTKLNNRCSSSASSQKESNEKKRKKPDSNYNCDKEKSLQKNIKLSNNISNTSNNNKNNSDVKKDNFKWTTQVNQWSDQLWSCDQTNCGRSFLKTSSGIEKGFIKNCWFKVKKFMNKNNKPPCSLPNDELNSLLEEERKMKKKEQEKKESVAIKVGQKKANEKQDQKEKVCHSKKIRYYPTIKERNQFNEWFGVYRWTYNQCVAFYREWKKKR